jgi:hypothetical protein
VLARRLTTENGTHAALAEPVIAEIADTLRLPGRA